MDFSALQAARGYAQTAGRSQQGGDSAAAGTPVGQALKDFTQVLAETEAVAETAMTSRADPHALVEALANTQLAVETAVTVRDRVVEAYQEILRMPV
ncbi:flagellar hook-basal body complex protein FliE [Alphaproteobacteria bacterium GH1-50]|uniref:Flagellar hook-basal body complex protein FliE n=1 Tax=Kangsaoukella pontilimi TaxID=2691042 RepID=A0A7C9N0J9_9RHOB|nr:flagellar hook-basal body complex protein FliE [Kangsaoukella pontilimi]MXQ08178.1 flagellar hook-basal body complex protein FliE [Kangsaoukella pontilimi]